MNSRPLSHHLVGEETSPYNPVEVPDGYIAEYVLGDSNPMLIQISGQRQVTGVDLESGSDFSVTTIETVGEASNPYAALQSVSGEARLQREVTYSNLKATLSQAQRDFASLRAFIDSKQFDALPKAEQDRLLRHKFTMTSYIDAIGDRVDKW